MKLVNGMMVWLVIMLIGNIVSGQTRSIYSVKFKFKHSRRIKDNFVSVDIRRYGDSVSVAVKSMPMDTFGQWKKSIRKYAFVLSLAEFDKVVTVAQAISCADIVNDIGVSGFDGTTCEIEIGGIENGITYKVWSPDYDTKRRHMQPFLDACKLILITAKLDPTKIL